MQKLYLDVCCLNRPFDDQTQIRIRLETEAILALLKKYENEEIKIYKSDISKFEISKIPDEERKLKVKLLSLDFENITLTNTIKQRARELNQYFDLIDALHIASAEIIGLDIFLTTDDEILNEYSKRKEFIKIHIQNPLEWIMEEN